METDYLKTLKQFGKIDWDDEDDLLLLFLEAARDTLAAAGVPRENDTALYRLAVYRLAMHYYENREEIGAVDTSIPMGMSWMVEHLRLSDGAGE